MLVWKIFLTLFSQTIFGKKIKFEQGISKKKLSTQAKIIDKMIVQVGNGPLPPPPITFLMVRPLRTLHGL